MERFWPPYANFRPTVDTLSRRCDYLVLPSFSASFKDGLDRLLFFFCSFAWNRGNLNGRVVVSADDVVVVVVEPAESFSSTSGEVKGGGGGGGPRAKGQGLRA